MARIDSILTRIAERPAGRRRLWIEDSFSRLSRNGFEPGVAFNVEPRMGPGVNIRPALLGEYMVSRRRQSAILSHETSFLASRFSAPEARVKVSVGLVQVLPSLRVFSVQQQSDEVWRIDANGIVTTPRGAIELHTGREVVSGRPASLSLIPSMTNLVAATDFISRVKPGMVQIGVNPSTPLPATGQLDLFSDSPSSSSEIVPSIDEMILNELCRQFLVGCGYSVDKLGHYSR